MTSYLARTPIRPTQICVFPPDQRPSDCARRCFTPRCLTHNAILTSARSSGDRKASGKEPSRLHLAPC